MNRRWFQIHLSTIVFVTMFAGALLGFNMCDRDIKWRYQSWYAHEYTTLKTWGWPIELGMAGTFVREYPAALPDSEDAKMHFELSQSADGSYFFRYRDSEYSRKVAINVIVCLGICLAVTVICELVIRTLVAPACR